VRQIEQQQTSAHDLLISNQVAKGFELLGNKEGLLQRLGGIYALEGVMNTSKEYYQPVLEALCAFVRDGTKNGTAAGPLITDIQAALTVIGRIEFSEVPSDQQLKALKEIADMVKKVGDILPLDANA
jgi:hypothetical protein